MPDALVALLSLIRIDDQTAPLRPPPSWEQLFDTAERHDVMGLAAAALLAGRAGQLPDDLREGLEIYREGVELKSRRAEAQLARILGEFARRGVPAMPFKGPLLARIAWPGVAVRTCRDLDLMIRPEHVSDALACLCEAGYAHRRGIDAAGVAALRGYAGQLILFRDGSLPVEPHWSPAPRTMAFDVDMAAIWRRAVPGHFLGAPCWLPAPEDHFFLLALHGAKEQWHKLKWLADIAAFQRANPALDLHAARTRAASLGCRRIFDLAVLLSHRLFAEPSVPPPADAATGHLADAVVARLAMTAEPPLGPYVVTWFHLRCRERWRDRAQYVVRTSFTPRLAHYSRLPLPLALRWLHVPLKLPWDLMLTPAIRLLRQMYRRARMGR